MGKIWTRNFYDILTAYIGTKGTTDLSTPGYSAPSPRVRNTAGGWAATTHVKSIAAAPTLLNGDYFIANMQYTSNTYGTNSGLGIALYNGATGVVSFDDYAHDPNSTLVTGFGRNSASQPNSTYDSATHTYNLNGSITLSNTTASDKTFNEICLYVNVSPNDAAYYILVYHEILDEAVTVPANGSLVVNVSKSTPVLNYHPY